MILRRTLFAAVALALAGSLPAGQNAGAAGLSGAKSGSFKVVKPPPRGARNRLTILGTKRSQPPGARRGPRHDWFWKIASDDIRAASAVRVGDLAASAAKRLGGSSEAKRISSIRASFGDEIDAAAKRAGISPALLTAVVAAESAGDPKAVSPAGAQGLAQLMPGTAKRFDVDDPFDPAQNLRGSATYLDILLKMFDEDAVLALAGYNAGENAVLRHDGVPPFTETRDYVPIVLSYYGLAQSGCAAPAPTARAPCDAKKAP